MTNKAESNPAMPPKNATHFRIVAGNTKFYEVGCVNYFEWYQSGWFPLGVLTSLTRSMLKPISEYAIPAQTPATSRQKLLIDELTAASVAYRKQHCALMITVSSDSVNIHHLDMRELVKNDLHITVELNKAGTILDLEKALLVVGGL